MFKRLIAAVLVEMVLVSFAAGGETYVKGLIG